MGQTEINEQPPLPALLTFIRLLLFSKESQIKEDFDLGKETRNHLSLTFTICHSSSRVLIPFSEQMYYVVGIFKSHNTDRRRLQDESKRWSLLDLSYWNCWHAAGMLPV